RRRTVPPSGGSGNSVARWRTVRACVCRGHCSRLPLLYRAPRERATVLYRGPRERATVRWPVSGCVAGVEGRPYGVSCRFGSEPGVEDRVERAVLLDHQQPSVEGVDELVAFLYREPELVTRLDLADTDGKLPCVLLHEGVCRGVVDHHAVDVAVEEGEDGSVEVVVKLHTVAAHELLRRDGVGGPVLGAENEVTSAEVVEGETLVFDTHGDRLVDGEV